MTGRVKNAFLTLLRAGLWNRPVGELHFFPLTDVEWEELYHMSLIQTVEGIVFDAVLNLPEPLLPPKGLLYKWTVRIDRMERNDMVMNRVLDEIVVLFARHDIYPYLLKGFSLAKHYHNPKRRISGDIDLYFDSIDAFNKANELVKSQGVLIERGTLRSSHYVWKGYTIEHHTRMVDIMNPFAYAQVKRIEREERDQVAHIPMKSGEMLKSPSDFVNHILVNAHILKHFIGLGIGLRQFCDQARLCYRSKDRVDGDVLERTYKKLGIHKWMEQTYALIVEHLGMDKDYLPYECVRTVNSDWLLEEILKVGNFGHHDSRHRQNKTLSLDVNKEKVIRRVLPHMFKALTMAPKEVFWFPVQRLWTKYLAK